MSNKYLISIFLFLSFFGLFASSTHAQSFSFGAAGDFANGTNFQNTVTAARNNNLSFMLGLGDFSYTPGAESDWCGKWNNTSTGFNKIVLISGNHDAGESTGGNINNYRTFCSYRPTGFIGSTVGDAEAYGKRYYFDYPQTNPLVRFIMVGPGLGNLLSAYNSYNSTTGASYLWTAAAIDGARASNIPWVVVGMHKNFISTFEKSNEVGTTFMNMLLSKHVDLILQGHEHGYERTYQLGCATPNQSPPSGCIVDADSVSMVKGAGSIIHVVGTGGQGLRGDNQSDNERGYFVKINVNSYGLSKFTVTSTTLDHTFIKTNSAGTLTDNFSIGGTVSTTPTSVPPSVTPNPTTAPTPTVGPAPTAPPASGYIDNAICNPDLGPSAFTNNITNTFMPFATWNQSHTLRNSSNGEQVVMTVMPETKQIPGVGGIVNAMVLEEYETIQGSHTETSYNWFVQTVGGARPGTVCYMGEYVTTYPDLGHAGSWQAGDPNARAGIMMPSSPAVGMNFLIEDAAAYGAHEDGVVNSVGQSYTTPAGTFPNTVQIFEAAGASEKRYGAGVGMIYDSGMVLVDPVFTNPPSATPAISPTLIPTPSVAAVCGPANTGQVTLSASLNPGNYTAWSRIKSTTGARSYWLKVDNQCLFVTSDTPVPDWTWVKTIQFSLSDSSQVVNLIGQDTNLRVDRLIFTQENCIPTGLGDNCAALPTIAPSNTPNPTLGPSTQPNPTDPATPSDTPPPPAPGSQTSGAIKASADTRVLDTSPDTNYGAKSLLRINGIPSGQYREMTRAYLLFDLAAFDRTSINSLKLRVYVQTGDGGTTNTQLIKSVENTSWEEYKMTYNTAPAMGSTLATIGPVGSGRWVEVALPTSVIGSANKVSLGIEACSGCRDGLSLNSRETSTPPQLIINGGAPLNPTGTGGSSDGDDD